MNSGNRFPRLWLACWLAGAHLPAAAAPLQPLAARWTAGQSWRVEYLRSVPSPAAGSSPRPAPPERSLWKYEVAGADAQSIRLRVTEEGGERRFELLFAPTPLALRRVTKIAGSRPSDLIVHAAPGPYFGWSPAYPLIFDWPALPVARQASRRQFTDDDGQRIEQAVRFTGPSRFEIVMTSRRKVDAGFIETQRAVQSWKEGSPWWTSASVEKGRVIDGKVSDEVSIRGRLIP